MPRKLNPEVGVIEKIKSVKLPALLRDKKKMAAIALSAESGSIKDLDACMLYSFLDSLAPKEPSQEEKTEQPQIASKIEIEQKLILLRNNLTVDPVSSLDQLIEKIKEHFKGTGCKMPVNRENDTNMALQVGVSNNDTVNSFSVNIEKNEYVVLLKNNYSVAVIIIGHSGQRIPVAF